MSQRREVNVERPEHSWIPFYRELARELVEGRWRDRQGELVRILQRMQTNGIPMPSVVKYMKDQIDPFTVYALFSRELRFDNTLRVMQAFKERFKLIAELPRERPSLPYADNRSVGYFSRFVGIDAEINVMWDLFEIVVKTESFDDIEQSDSLIRLIDEGLQVRGVAISKLTSAFYWVNPYHFLHSDTVNAIGGKSLRIKATDGESYLRSLEKTREVVSEAFPDINVAVWKGEEFDVTWLKDRSDRPDVWIMRGGRDAHAVDAFLERGYAGIGFNLQEDDLSVLSNADEIRDLYQERNPSGTASNQVIDFRLKVKPGDYVLMPGEGSRFSHYGKFASDVFNDGQEPYKNKRKVDWSERTIPREELDLSNYQRTLVHPNPGVRERFFEIINAAPPSLPSVISPESYTIEDMLKDGLFFDRDELQRIHDRFGDKGNLILQGPPGVGKTFVTRRLAYALMGERADDRIVNVQFHQSYSYEEFVHGYRPDVNERDELVFKMHDGTFLRLCARAREDDDQSFVLIIDEINRGNLSRVFGELLSMIEKDKRGDGFSVELQGGERFSVPKNVYILGTMNLADRSLAGMDYAMRRRFAFVTLEPQFGKQVFENWLRNRDVPDGMIERINSRMSALNEVISNDTSLGRNFAVGHSYFCDIADGGEGDWDSWYRNIVETEIQPLLEEYWFDNLGKAGETVNRLLGEE